MITRAEVEADAEWINIVAKEAYIDWAFEVSSILWNAPLWEELEPVIRYAWSKAIVTAMLRASQRIYELTESKLKEIKVVDLYNMSYDELDSWLDDAYGKLEDLDVGSVEYEQLADLIDEAEDLYNSEDDEE